MYVFVVRLIALVAFGIAGFSAIDANALALTGVTSRKLHGTVGTFNLPIDSTQAFGASVTVEPRAIGTGHVIVFQFDGIIITPGTVSLADAFGSTGAVSAPVITGIANDQISVILTGIADNKRVMLSLTQVNNLLGGSGDFVVSIGFLVGDVDNNRVVTPNDVSRVKARSGQSATAISFVYDINSTGTINSSDISAVKARMGLPLVTASEVALFVAKPGTGLGTITSTPAGINCGIACAANFNQNTPVTVMATPSTGSTFTNWSGACSGAMSTSNIVLATNAICNANFTVNTYNVTPSATVNGSISPLAVQIINHGARAIFTIVPDLGFAASVGGTCGGSLVGTTYTTNPITAACTVAASFVTAPVILYTDILSGPNVGGENNKGIYLSIFGKNFGSSGLGTNTKVFINNVEVDNYRYLGVSRGRTDIQQITVQIGALGNPTLGTQLPIRVSVNGMNSNTDLTFMVNPGTIYFASLTGNDSTAVPGSISSPYRTVQTAGINNNGVVGCPAASGSQSVAAAGVWGLVKGGDFIVMRGGTWLDISKDAFFLRVQNKSGSAPTGVVGSGSITVMGYPTETPFINRPNTINRAPGGAISSADSARQLLGCGAWVTLSNLKVDSGFNDGMITTQAGATNPVGSHWRVVNVEMSANTCQANDNCKGAGVTGSGLGNYWAGNYVHDVYDMPGNNTDFEHHGFYMDGIGSYEVAYNRIENIVGGNGIQMNSTTSPITNNALIHHNVINGVGKHGINLANGAEAGIVIYNNIVANTALAGFRTGSTDIVGAKIFNNTFYNTNLNHNPVTGAIKIEAPLASGALEIRNNIFVGTLTGGMVTDISTCNLSPMYGTYSNNLYFNLKDDSNSNCSNFGLATIEPGAIKLDPKFVSIGTNNVHLLAGSPAIGTGTNSVSLIVVDDFDAVNASGIRTIRLSAPWDIGAFKF